MRTFILFGLLCLLAPSCVSTSEFGHDIDPVLLKSLSEGMSKSQVFEILGEPQRSTADGTRDKWSYWHAWITRDASGRISKIRGIKETELVFDNDRLVWSPQVLTRGDLDRLSGGSSSREVKQAIGTPLQIRARDVESDWGWAYWYLPQDSQSPTLRWLHFRFEEDSLMGGPGEWLGDESPPGSDSRPEPGETTPQ